LVPLKPGQSFVDTVKARLPSYERNALALKPTLTASSWREVEDSIKGLHEGETNKLYSRLGWMTRIHPIVVGDRRLLLPVYHDGLSCSLFAITDDWGGHWHVSVPLIGNGNVQPSVALRRDGSLYTMMRDNGPPPHRAMSAESRDRGETWSPVVDTEIPNPGSSLEVVVLRSHRWILVGNDQENSRSTLAVWTSDDEGRSWQWRRTLAKPGPLGDSFSYPSVIQTRDGRIHVTCSAPKGQLSTILHCEFNEAWLFNPPIHSGDQSFN
jgi:predicted neuraminidase